MYWEEQAHICMYETLKKICECRPNAPLAKYSTFKVGGPAKFFCSPKTKKEFIDLIKFLDGVGERYTIIGSASNTLFPDEGYDGVVISFAGKNIKTEEADQTIIIVAESGAITADVARKSVELGGTGFEWGVGIPGTIGGALFGNAGAGLPVEESNISELQKTRGEMKDIVKAVDVWYNGNEESWGKDQLWFDYRNSIFKRKKAVILAVKIELQKSQNRTQGVKQMIDMIKYRTSTQPKDASCGCVFKNPIVDGKRQSAGRLIDEAGCKGMKEGGAEVSAVHGNFIVNHKNATSSDIKNLIEKIKEKVRNRFNIELEEEIQII